MNQLEFGRTYWNPDRKGLQKQKNLKSILEENLNMNLEKLKKNLAHKFFLIHIKHLEETKDQFAAGVV